ncbi:MAG: M48 family metallopeptidase [Magnetococcales bacterium]|nr:M48 family metallopeptidase [Magnetococcales bacterium]
MSTCHALHFSGHTVAYHLKRDRRRTRIKLEINTQGELCVKAPAQAPNRVIEQVIKEHGQWIIQTQQQAASSHQEAIQRPDLIQLPFLDETLTVRFSDGELGRVEPNILQIPMDFEFPDERLVAALEHWYRFQAHGRLRSSIDTVADQMDTQINKVTIRGQKTRWGSCSSKGNISLNWKLMFLPNSIIQYVIVHELAHRTHMNHSPAFWSLVSRYDPDYKKHRTLLKKFKEPWPFNTV